LVHVSKITTVSEHFLLYFNESESSSSIKDSNMIFVIRLLQNILNRKTQVLVVGIRNRLDQDSITMVASDISATSFVL
jgi:hypothetical protein